MGRGIAGLDKMYHIVFIAALIILAVMLMLCSCHHRPADCRQDRLGQYDGNDRNGDDCDSRTDAGGRLSG